MTRLQPSWAHFGWHPNHTTGDMTPRAFDWWIAENVVMEFGYDLRVLPAGRAALAEQEGQDARA